MNDNDYFWPGIAAIAISILFPSYWIIEFSSGDLDTLMYIGVSPNIELLDAVWLTVGALTIYVYYQFVVNLNQNYNYSGANVVIFCLMGLSTFFYFGLFIIDLVLIMQSTATEQQNTMLSNILLWLTIGCVVLFGILEIILGVLLLITAKILTPIITALAIATLVLGIAEITVVFSFLSIFIYPVTTGLLAVHFLKKPDLLEII